MKKSTVILLWLFNFIIWGNVFIGCMSDRTALQKVLTKEPLFDTVGKVYTSLHPCDNKVISHSSDTSYLHDTSIVTCHDTVGNYIHDTTTITHTNTIHIHDKDTIVDNQQLSILKSQIEDKDKQIAILNQAVTDSRLQAAANEKDASRWELYFWLLIAAIVIALVLYIIKPRL